MTEITKGIVNAVKDRMDESLLLAIIFFIGHIIIAMAVVSIITGASIWEAGAVALIEPAVNSVWFYALHKLWKKYK
jgi:uncharacterized membrane protein|tara:strand:- start:178 stop:405 length:228 start_codon:yes stop_codon:yes gene_type:complete